MSRSVRLDIMLAVLMAALAQAEMWLYDGGPQGAATVTAISSSVFTGLLALRTARTEWMAGLATAVLLSQAMLGGRMTSTLTVAFTAMLMLFSIGLLLRRRRAVGWAAAFLGAAWFDLLAIQHEDFGVVSDLAFTGVIVVAAPFLVGRALRDRRERTDELERVNEELRQERAETARLAVLEERSRIARDVHDVVAHSVSLMVVQVGAARRLLDSDTEQSRAALIAVENVGRDAVQELRRTLGLLRGPEHEPPELTPQPGLAQLAVLVESARRSGMDVEVDVGEMTGGLGPGADVTAYRVVQECLTNARKHAEGARVRVAVTPAPPWLRLTVSDDGPGPAAIAHAGHGLRGMRERVEIHGGELRAGAGPRGGFTVEALLPHPEEER